jgi:hypothetical protein
MSEKGKKACRKRGRRDIKEDPVPQAGFIAAVNPVYLAILGTHHDNSYVVLKFAPVA